METEIKTTKRQDTRKESEGAEFLVLGMLLIRGLPAFKDYRNTPGYDLIVAKPRIPAITIQVKSRWRTNANGFIINQFDSDFVVVCLLNRGNKSGKVKEKAPEFFVFPTEVLKSVKRGDKFGKVNFSNVPNHEDYRDRWDLIKDKLEEASAGLPAEDQSIMMKMEKQEKGNC